MNSLTPSSGSDDGVAAIHRQKYEEAVRHWAYSIAVDNGLQGIAMGRVFALADVLGINANVVVADLREAQAQIETAAGTATL